MAERAITPNRPSLGTPTAIISKSGEDTYVDIRWTATDPDQNSLTHFVQMASSDSTVFWPVAHALTTPDYRLQLTPDVRRGTYVVRVLSSDGVNVESRDVTFTL